MTEELFARTTEAIYKSFGRRLFIPIDSRALRRAHEASVRAEAVALWAQRELKGLSRWKWRRRRYLRQVLIDNVQCMESLTATFGPGTIS